MHVQLLFNAFKFTSPVYLVNNALCKCGYKLCNSELSSCLFRRNFKVVMYNPSAMSVFAGSISCHDDAANGVQISRVENLLHHEMYITEGRKKSWDIGIAVV